jgi:hypothetical protein
VIDSRTLQSTPKSGARAGYDGAVTPANQGDREQVVALAQELQQVTGGTVETGLCRPG